MSLQTCQTGATTGFPIILSQNLYKDWPATANSQAQIQKLVVPTDFTIQWGPPAEGAQISVRQGKGVFQITGFNTISDNTTLTYGSATYVCSEVLSLVQNQHKTLCYDSNANYEIILAFQINNKSLNPSSPDVILISRPIVFSTKPQGAVSFWAAVNGSAKSGKPQSTAVDLSQIYGYSQKVLLPMISYQSCLPVKLLNYRGASSQLGSITVRTHVIPQAMQILADDSGIGQCSSVSKYTLITSPRRLIDLFQGSADTVLQFQDGLGPGKFPSGANENLVPLAVSSRISAFQNVLQLLKILVPEEFLGKSLAEIAESKVHTPKVGKKKAFKCYRIDPETDIKDDQILVDPTTGESLADTMRQKAYDDSGGDPALVLEVDSSGIMPGDIQTTLTNLLIFIGSITLLAYLLFIAHTLLYRENGFHTGIRHIVICVVIVVVLSVIGYYLNVE